MIDICTHQRKRLLYTKKYENTRLLTILSPYSLTSRLSYLAFSLLDLPFYVAFYQESCLQSVEANVISCLITSSQFSLPSCASPNSCYEQPLTLAGASSHLFINLASFILSSTQTTPTFLVKSSCIQFNELCQNLLLLILEVTSQSVLPRLHFQYIPLLVVPSFSWTLFFVFVLKAFH